MGRVRYVTPGAGWVEAERRAEAEAVGGADGLRRTRLGAATIDPLVTYVSISFL